MAKGEAAAVAAGYRDALRRALSNLDEAALRGLRGEPQVVERWLADRSDERRGLVARGALRSVSRHLQFSLDVRGFSGSRQAAETASLFDLASVGVLAVENVLSAEKRTPMRLPMSGLAEGLMFLASRQYVRGGDIVLETTYRAHAMELQDELWALAMEFREREGLEAIREARGSIDEVFRKLEDPSVPPATKVGALHLLYALVVVIRCVRLLEELESGR